MNAPDALVRLALALAVSESHPDMETLGPITMSRPHWDLLWRVARLLLTFGLALGLVRLVPVLERTVIRLATIHQPAKDATVSTIERQQRIETLTRVTSSLAQAVIWTMTLIVLLGDVGVSIAPLLATAGIAGIAIGFGAQSIVRDFFAGFFILLENQFDVGDTVTIGTVTGVVERMTMRITVLRDVNGTAHFLPNSTITLVSNRTYGWGRAAVEVSFAGGLDESDVRAALDLARERAESMLREGGMSIEPPVVEGPVEFAATGLTWRLVAKTRPERTAEARQLLIKTLSRVLRERHLASSGGVFAKAS